MKKLFFSSTQSLPHMLVHAVGGDSVHTMPLAYQGRCIKLGERGGHLPGGLILGSD